MTNRTLRSWMVRCLRSRNALSLSTITLSLFFGVSTHAQETRIFDATEMLSVDEVVGSQAPVRDSLIEPVNCENESYSDCCDETCYSVSGGCNNWAPNMIGDSVTIPRRGIGINNYWSVNRVANNNSALPTDRVGFSYNMSHNVANVRSALAPNSDTEMHEYSFLAEKKLFGDDTSIQMIIPFSQTVASNQSITALGADDIEFGNIAFNLKRALVRNSNAVVSVGLQVEVPTADDIAYNTPTIPIFPPFIVIPSTQTVLENDAWNFTPYVAALFTPTERLFLHNFISYRMPSNQNDQSFQVGAGTPVSLPGLREQNMLMIDTGIGYWMYRNQQKRGITGFAPTLELHYTTTTNSPDGALQSAFLGHVDMLDLTLGSTTTIGENATIGLGVSVPLRTTNAPIQGATDRMYDYQLALQLNLFRR